MSSATHKRAPRRSPLIASDAGRLISTAHSCSYILLSTYCFNKHHAQDALTIPHEVPPMHSLGSTYHPPNRTQFRPCRQTPPTWVSFDVHHVVSFPHRSFDRSSRHSIVHLPILLEANVHCLLAEAPAANVHTVFADQPLAGTADAALAATLGVLPRVLVVDALVRHDDVTRSLLFTDATHGESSQRQKRRSSTHAGGRTTT